MKIFVRDRQFYRNIVVIAIPIVLQSLITTGVNMMDTIMLTSCGETQLSASSLANQFISLMQFLCMGLGSGAAVLTAQYWGVNDIKSIRSVTTLMLRVGMIVAALFMAATLLFPSSIMRIYTPDAATVVQGVRYLRVSAFTLPLHALVVTLTCVLRSVRKVKVPLYSSIVAFFVNIFFNWVFIFGKLGAPRLEIAGAAYGTLIARAVECGIILFVFFFKDQRIGYRFRHLLLPCSAYLKNYMYYSSPVVASDMLLGVGNNLISVIMGHIGTGFVSAFAVVSLITRMSNVLTMGMANVASTLTGNALGAGEKQKAYEQGVEPSKWYGVYDKHKEINAQEGLSATDKATEFAHWLQTSGDYSAQERNLFRDQFGFYTTLRADAERFDALRQAGLSADEANSVYDAVSALVPEAGETQVSRQQQYEAIIGLDTLTDTEKLKALTEYEGAGKGDRRKFETAYNYGVSPERYVDMLALKDEGYGDTNWDGEGSHSYDADEARTLVDHMLDTHDDMTREEAAVLWAMIMYNNKTKNPYGNVYGPYMEWVEG